MSVERLQVQLEVDIQQLDKFNKINETLKYMNKKFHAVGGAIDKTSKSISSVSTTVLNLNKRLSKVNSKLDVTVKKLKELQDVKTIISAEASASLDNFLNKVRGVAEEVKATNTAMTSLAKTTNKASTQAKPTNGTKNSSTKVPETKKEALVGTADYEALMKELNKAIQSADRTTKKYGFTVDGLGKKLTTVQDKVGNVYKAFAKYNQELEKFEMHSIEKDNSGAVKNSEKVNKNLQAQAKLQKVINNLIKDSAKVEYDVSHNKDGSYDVLQKITTKYNEVYKVATKYADTESKILKIKKDLSATSTLNKEISDAQKYQKLLEENTRKLKEFSKTQGFKKDSTKSSGGTVTETYSNDNFEKLEVQKRLNEVTKQYELITARASKNIQKQTKALKDSAKASQLQKLNQQKFKDVYDNFKGIVQQSGKFNENIHTLTQGSDVLKSSTRQLKDGWSKVTQEVKINGNQVKKVSAEINSAGTKVRNVSSEVKKTFRDNLGFIQQMGVAMQKFTQWLMVGSAIMQSWRFIKDTVATVYDLNKKMTELRIVMPEGTNFQAIEEGANSSAMALGGLQSEMLSASVQYARQGKEVAEINELVRSSALASNISNMELTETVDLLTSSLNQFKMTAEDSMHITDVYSQLANKSASNFQELAIAISKSGVSAKEGQVPFEKMSSYVATLLESTRQAPETVGNSLKTVFARMSKAGETTDEELNKVETALGSVGIALRESETEFRSVSDVLDQLNLVWRNLDGVTKSYLATEIAGVRQKNMFLSLMDSYNRSLDLNSEALNSNGSSLAQNEKYMEGIEAKLNRLKATIKTFQQHLLGSDTMGIVIDGLTKFVKGIDSAFQKLGKWGKFLLFINASMLVLGKHMGTVGGLISGVASLGTQFAGLIGRLVTTTVVTQTTTVATGGLATAFAGLGTVLSGLGLPVVIAGISVAIIGLLATYESAEEKATRYAEAQQKVNDVLKSGNIQQLEEQKGMIEDLLVSYDAQIKKVEKLGNTMGTQSLHFQKAQGELQELATSFKDEFGLSVDEARAKVELFNGALANRELDNKYMKEIQGIQEISNEIGLVENLSKKYKKLATAKKLDSAQTLQLERVTKSLKSLIPSLDTKLEGNKVLIEGGTEAIENSIKAKKDHLEVAKTTALQEMILAKQKAEAEIKGIEATIKATELKMQMMKDMNSLSEKGISELLLGASGKQPKDLSPKQPLSDADRKKFSNTGLGKDYNKSNEKLELANEQLAITEKYIKQISELSSEFGSGFTPKVGDDKKDSKAKKLADTLRKIKEQVSDLTSIWDDFNTKVERTNFELDLKSQLGLTDAKEYLSNDTKELERQITELIGLRYKIPEQIKEFQNEIHNLKNNDDIAGTQVQAEAIAKYQAKINQLSGLMADDYAKLNSEITKTAKLYEYQNKNLEEGKKLLDSMKDAQKEVVKDAEKLAKSLSSSIQNSADMLALNKEFDTDAFGKTIDLMTKQRDDVIDYIKGTYEATRKLQKARLDKVEVLDEVTRNMNMSSGSVKSYWQEVYKAVLHTNDLQATLNKLAKETNQVKDMFTVLEDIEVFEKMKEKVDETTDAIKDFEDQLKEMENNEIFDSSFKDKYQEFLDIGKPKLDKSDSDYWIKYYQQQLDEAKTDIDGLLDKAEELERMKFDLTHDDKFTSASKSENLEAIEEQIEQLEHKMDLLKQGNKDVVDGFMNDLDKFNQMWEGNGTNPLENFKDYEDAYNQISKLLGGVSDSQVNDTAKKIQDYLDKIKELKAEYNNPIHAGDSNVLEGIHKNAEEYRAKIRDLVDGLSSDMERLASSGSLSKDLELGYQNQIDMLEDLMDELENSGGNVDEIMDSINDKLGDTNNQLEDMADNYKEIEEALEKAKEQAEMMEKIKGIVSDLFSFTADELLADKTDQYGNIIKRMGDEAVRVFDIYKAIGELGSGVMDKLKEGMEGVIKDLLKDSSLNLADIIMGDEAFEDMADQLTGSMDGVMDYWNGLVKGMGTSFTDYFSSGAFTSVITSAVGGIASSGQVLSDLIKASFVELPTLVAEIIAGLPELVRFSMESIIISVGNNVISMINEIAKALNSALQYDKIPLLEKIQTPDAPDVINSSNNQTTNTEQKTYSAGNTNSVHVENHVNINAGTIVGDEQSLNEFGKEIYDVLTELAERGIISFNV